MAREGLSRNAEGAVEAPDASMVALSVPKIGRPDALAAVMRGAALPFEPVLLLGVGDVVGIGDDVVLGEMARALGQRVRRRTATHQMVRDEMAEQEAEGAFLSIMISQQMHIKTNIG